MRLSTFIILACMAVGILFLSALGLWQLKRLDWKEDLIATVESRMNSEPLSLTELEALWNEKQDVEFVPVKVRGEFNHDVEQFYYVTNKGQVGWHVYAPLKLVSNDRELNGKYVIVNRGFVPDAFKSQAKRLEGLTRDIVEITALARNPLSEKPNRFVPENDLEKNIYYWKSHAHMSAQMDLGKNKLSYFLDEGKGSNTQKLPIGGITRVEFPNNHMQYALTWFGLAFALLGVGSYFLYSRRREKRR